MDALKEFAEKTKGAASSSGSGFKKMAIAEAGGAAAQSIGASIFGWGHTPSSSSEVDLEAGSVDEDTSFLGKASGALRAGSNKALGAMSAGKAKAQEVAISPTQIRNASISFALGAFFLAGSFLFLPMIVFAPQKFALLFTCGSICIVSGVGFLRDPWTFTKSLLKRDKLPFSSAYIGSMIGTLYASLIMRSYILTVAAMLIQIASLLHFVFAYVPGGTRFLTIIWKVISNTVKLCCKALQR